MLTLYNKLCLFQLQQNCRIKFTTYGTKESTLVQQRHLLTNIKPMAAFWSNFSFAFPFFMGMLSLISNWFLFFSILVAVFSYDDTFPLGNLF